MKKLYYLILIIVLISCNYSPNNLESKTDTIVKIDSIFIINYDTIINIDSVFTLQLNQDTIYSYSIDTILSIQKDTIIISKVDTIYSYRIDTIFIQKEEEQNQNSNFIIHQSWDFENRDIGYYSSEMVDIDFKVRTNYHHNSGFIDTATINDKLEKVLKVKHVVNQYFQGFDLHSELDSNYCEVYLTYLVFLPENWAQSTGKLPGLAGSPLINAGDCNPPSRGFLCRLNFKPGNHINDYYYSHNSQYCPWNTPCDAYFSYGEWHEITQRVVLNTFTNGIPDENGIHEIWLDKKLISQVSTHVLFADESLNGRIDDIAIASFYNINNYNECFSYFDKFTIWTYLDHDITGHALHDPDYLLQTPLNF